MWRFKRSRRQFDAEEMLRSHRAEPQETFVKSLAQQIDAQPPARERTAWSRLAFAGATSTMIVGMFASFGGIGYAASGATSTYSAVKKVVVQHRLSVDVHESSAADQYKPKPKPPKQNVAGQAGESKGQALGAVKGANTLPFTGISLAVTALIGTLLLLTGVMLRRRERSES